MRQIVLPVEGENASGRQNNQLASDSNTENVWEQLTAFTPIFSSFAECLKPQDHANLYMLNTFSYQRMKGIRHLNHVNIQCSCVIKQDPNLLDMYTCKSKIKSVNISIPLSQQCRILLDIAMKNNSNTIRKITITDTECVSCLTLHRLNEPWLYDTTPLKQKMKHGFHLDSSAKFYDDNSRCKTIKLNNLEFLSIRVGSNSFEYVMDMLHHFEFRRLKTLKIDKLDFSDVSAGLSDIVAEEFEIHSLTSNSIYNSTDYGGDDNENTSSVPPKTQMFDVKQKPSLTILQKIFRFLNLCTRLEELSIELYECKYTELAYIFFVIMKATYKSLKILSVEPQIGAMSMCVYYRNFFEQLKLCCIQSKLTLWKLQKFDFIGIDYLHIDYLKSVNILRQIAPKCIMRTWNVKVLLNGSLNTNQGVYELEHMCLNTTELIEEGEQYHDINIYHMYNNIESNYDAQVNLNEHNETASPENCNKNYKVHCHQDASSEADHDKSITCEAVSDSGNTYREYCYKGIQGEAIHNYGTCDNNACSQSDGDNDQGEQRNCNAPSGIVRKNSSETGKMTKTIFMEDEYTYKHIIDVIHFQVNESDKVVLSQLINFIQQIYIAVKVADNGLCIYFPKIVLSDERLNQYIYVYVRNIIQKNKCDANFVYIYDFDICNDLHRLLLSNIEFNSDIICSMKIVCDSTHICLDCGQVKQSPSELNEIDRISTKELNKRIFLWESNSYKSGRGQTERYAGTQNTKTDMDVINYENTNISHVLDKIGMSTAVNHKCIIPRNSSFSFRHNSFASAAELFAHFLNSHTTLKQAKFVDTLSSISINSCTRRLSIYSDILRIISSQFRTYCLEETLLEILTYLYE